MKAAPYLTDVAVSPDKNRVAVGFSGRPVREGEPYTPTVSVVDLKSGKTTVVGNFPVARAVAWSPDSKWLAVSGQEPSPRNAPGAVPRVVRLFDARGQARDLPMGPSPVPCEKLCFSPDSTRLAGGTTIPTSMVNTAFGTTGHRGTGNGPIYVWDVPNAKLLAKIVQDRGDGFELLGFSSPRKLLMAGVKYGQVVGEAHGNLTVFHAPGRDGGPGTTVVGDGTKDTYTIRARNIVIGELDVTSAPAPAVPAGPARK
jgi:WD40 repeat protein